MQAHKITLMFIFEHKIPPIFFTEIMIGISRCGLYENIGVVTTNKEAKGAHWEKEEEGMDTGGFGGEGGGSTTTWMILYALVYHNKQKVIWIFHPLIVIPYESRK